MMPLQKVLAEARKLLAKAERDAGGRPMLDSLCSADLDGLDAAVKACGHSPLSPAVTRAAEGPDPMLRCPTYGELIAVLREVRTGFGDEAGRLASELANHLEHRATGGGK